MPGWSRAEKLTFYALIVAIIGVMAALFVAGVKLGDLQPGETGTIRYLSGKIISNTKNGFTSPIWGVPLEATDKSWIPLMPYAKEGLWTNAVFIEMAGRRIPFHDGQYEIKVRNDTATQQEVRLNFHEAIGFYSDNDGDAKFVFRNGQL